LNSIVNHLLDGDLRTILFDFYILSFLVFSQDFIIYIDFAHIVASTQQLMTLQIRSHIEYWTKTLLGHPVRQRTS